MYCPALYVGKGFPASGTSRKSASSGPSCLHSRIVPCRRSTITPPGSERVPRRTGARQSDDRYTRAAFQANQCGREPSRGWRVRRAVVGALVACLVCPSLVIGGDTLDDAGRPASESKPYKIKATLVSVNLQTMQLTYLDAGTGASGSASLTGKAATQSAELKPGTPVSLQVRSV